MNIQRNLYLLIARVFLGLAFLVPAWIAMVQPEAIQTLRPIEIAPIFYWIAIALLFLGGLSLILGVYTDAGVIAILLVLVPYTTIFYMNFDSYGNIFNLLQKLGLMAGLIYVYFFGPGEWNIVTEERYLLTQVKKHRRQSAYHHQKKKRPLKNKKRR